MEADAANMGESIADVAEQCRAALKTCLNILPLNEDYWAEERSQSSKIGLLPRAFLTPKKFHSTQS